MAFLVVEDRACEHVTLSVTRSRGWSFIPAEWNKIWGSGHFLGTRTVKQHHLCNIPYILSKRTVCTVTHQSSAVSNVRRKSTRCCLWWPRPTLCHRDCTCCPAATDQTATLQAACEMWYSR